MPNQSKILRGVFALQCAANNKELIFGMTVKENAFRKTEKVLNLGGHPNPDLQRDWTRFGPDQFKLKAVLWMGVVTVAELRKHVTRLARRYQPEYNPSQVTSKGTLIATARGRMAQMSAGELQTPLRPLPVAAIAILDRSRIVQIDDPGWPRLVQLGLDYPREIAAWADREMALDSVM